MLVGYNATQHTSKKKNVLNSSLFTHNNSFSPFLFLKEDYVFCHNSNDYATRYARSLRIEKKVWVEWIQLCEILSFL